MRLAMLIIAWIEIVAGILLFASGLIDEDAMSLLQGLISAGLGILILAYVKDNDAKERERKDLLLRIKEEKQD